MKRFYGKYQFFLGNSIQSSLLAFNKPLNWFQKYGRKRSTYPASKYHIARGHKKKMHLVSGAELSVDIKKVGLETKTV